MDAATRMPRSAGRSGRGAVAALVASMILPLALGGAGGIVTTRALPTWYAELAKPAWNPPPWIFGPVWTVLYLSMGIAAWLVWRRGGETESPEQRRRVRLALAAYGLQLGLNAVWSPTFFGLKRIDLALAVIAALVVTLIETVRRFGQLQRPAALLLLPYLAWTMFATALNAELWRLNPDAEGGDA